MRQHSLRMSPIAIAIAATSLGTVGSLPLATPVQAQDSLIEEVVVTARKRQESLQDVPVAVTALTPNQLERGSIQRTTDIDKMVPNVELHQTYIGSESLSATIRGIGFDDIEKSLEPTVGVAVDGVTAAKLAEQIGGPAAATGAAAVRGAALLATSELRMPPDAFTDGTSTG